MISRIESHPMLKLSFPSSYLIPHHFCRIHGSTDRNRALFFPRARM